MVTKKSQEIRVSSSVYQCDNVMQGEARNPLLGMLPFSSYVLKPKKNKSHDFGGAGLYACFYRDRLIYVGKYLGTKKDFRTGNIISLRWVKHVGTFTMMARNLTFSKKAIKQINHALESQIDIISQPILDAFPTVLFEMITRDRGCVSTYARFDVATRIWRELGQPTLDWLKEFSFIYTKIDTDLPCAEVRTFISRAEDVAVSKLRPPGNSIKDRSWSTHSIDEVSAVFADSLSCSYENTTDSTIAPANEPLEKTNSEPEEESSYMEFEEQIETAPHFAKEFIEKVKQEFASVDDASIEYTKCPDMRIRKIIDKGVGFINAVTIKWQPQNQRFVLATALNQGEVKFPVDIHEQGKTLTSALYLDETIINQNMLKILETLRYAQKNRVHGSHK